MSDVERLRAARRAYYAVQQGPVWDELNCKVDRNPEFAEADEDAIFTAVFERATLAQAIDRLESDQSP
jgi:hypothetical protein